MGHEVGSRFSSREFDCPEDYSDYNIVFSCQYWCVLSRSGLEGEHEEGGGRRH